MNDQTDTAHGMLIENPSRAERDDCRRQPEGRGRLAESKSKIENQKLLLPALVVLSLFPLLGFAQTATPTPAGSPAASPSPTRVPLWRADMPGGTYEVAIRSILSVSTHEYVVDGVARVTELNIDTPGNLAVRFYYIEPITATSPLGIGQATLDKVQDMAQQAMSRVNSGDQQPWQKVVKNYPTTTHAHTVEYRVESKDQITSLFNSADQALRSGQNAEIQVQ